MSTIKHPSSRVIVGAAFFVPARVVASSQSSTEARPFEPPWIHPDGYFGLCQHAPLPWPSRFLIKWRQDPRAVSSNKRRPSGGSCSFANFTSGGGLSAVATYLLKGNRQLSLRSCKSSLKRP
ncbi:hypothetical protein HDV64DRAFT_116906 [Trichoderma sp. TUCIM 5745]